MSRRRRQRALLPLAMLVPALSLAGQTASGPPALPTAAPAVRFMGIEADAKRVAFVCDGSRWTETKDEELFGELLRAVKPLTPEQEFSVVFFADDKARGLEAGRPVPATEANKTKLRDWLEDFEFGRDSTPDAGFKLAFEGKPDAIYFVSDGRFENYDEVARGVASLNPGRAVRVHAVGFFRNEAEDDSRAFVEFLRRLAEANGGQTKIAYAEEMKRRAN